MLPGPKGHFSSLLDMPLGVMEKPMATGNPFGKNIRVLVILAERLVKRGQEVQDIAWQWSTPPDGQMAMRELSDAHQHLVLALQALRRAPEYHGSRAPAQEK